MRLAVLVPTLVAAVLWAGSGAAAQQPPSDEPDSRITDGTAQRKLDAARESWRRARIDEYRYRIGRSCFCVVEAVRAVTVHVRDGRRIRPPKYYGDVATVPRLFRVVQDAIRKKAARLDVRYGTYGVPRQIVVDYERLTIDEEVGYVVDRFARERR